MFFGGVPFGDFELSDASGSDSDDLSSLDVSTDDDDLQAVAAEVERFEFEAAAAELAAGEARASPSPAQDKHRA